MKRRDRAVDLVPHYGGYSLIRQTLSCTVLHCCCWSHTTTALISIPRSLRFLRLRIRYRDSSSQRKHTRIVCVCVCVRSAAKTTAVGGLLKEASDHVSDLANSGLYINLLLSSKWERNPWVCFNRGAYLVKTKHYSYITAAESDYNIVLVFIDVMHLGIIMPRTGNTRPSPLMQ